MHGQRSQRYAPLTERFGPFEQMPQAPSEPIEFPDNKGVARGASGLNLVVAAIVLWNTVYLQRAARRWRTAAKP